MSEQQNFNRQDYAVFKAISTRWMDNDVYGHVNNVTYYSYFDTAVNQYLIEEGHLDIHQGDVVGFVVNSGCNYKKPLAYPDAIEVGIRVNKLGNSSVEYGVAIFKKGEDEPCAHGHFVHVFVNKNDNRPVSIPSPLRHALAAIEVQ